MHQFLRPKNSRPPRGLLRDGASVMDVPFYIGFMHGAVWVLAVGYLVSGLDEMVMTFAFIFWRLYRRFILLRGRQRLNLAMLEAKPEQTVAIMVPAWNEAAVIGRMLRYAVANIDYQRYMIFVGVYPNDPDTLAVVEGVMAEHPDHVRVAMVGNPGPTTKSDCLNAVMRRIRDWENETGRDVEIYVLHDAEDYVPRYGLKCFNYLIPQKAIVQIPVFPLAAPWWSMTEGHYMDEFAQLHVKDLRVREWLTGGVPSAGVGTAFSRGAMDLAWHDAVEGVFRAHLLTEDYEISMQLLRLGAPSAFFTGNVIGSRPEPEMCRLYALPGMPAVRGEFPHDFWPAVRQKTRWILGITLQGWESLGWYGSFWQRYILFRDRKPLVTNIANAVVYLFVLIWLIHWGLVLTLFPQWKDISLYPESVWLDRVMAVNMVLLTSFILVRGACTFLAYGPVAAVMSVPRIVWGNFVNFVATVRAVRQFVSARRQGITHIPWEKTDHAVKERRLEEAA